MRKIQNVRNVRFFLTTINLWSYRLYNKKLVGISWQCYKSMYHYNQSIYCVTSWSHFSVLWHWQPSLNLCYRIKSFYCICQSTTVTGRCNTKTLNFPNHKHALIWPMTVPHLAVTMVLVLKLLSLLRKSMLLNCL